MNDSVRNATNKGKVDSFLEHRAFNESEREREWSTDGKQEQRICRYFRSCTKLFRQSARLPANKSTQRNEKERITFDPITFHVVKYFQCVFHVCFFFSSFNPSFSVLLAMPKLNVHSKFAFFQSPKCLHMFR